MSKRKRSEIAGPTLDFEMDEVSGSFPFFDIARRTGSSYREVLRLVDAYDQDRAAAINDCPLPLEVCCMIYAVTRQPWRKSIAEKEKREHKRAMLNKS